MTEIKDDLDLKNFAESETESSDNGAEPEKQKKPAKMTDDSIIASDTLIAAAKRMGGFGLSGETRTAFEDEFEGLARLATKIFGVDEASKIMSLKGSLSDETRLLGGILTVAGGAALWRWVINKDLEKGGDVSSTGFSPGAQSKDKTTDKEENSKSEKDDKTTEQTDNPGDEDIEFSGSFHDKVDGKSESEDDTE